MLQNRPRLAFFAGFAAPPRGIAARAGRRIPDDFDPHALATGTRTEIREHGLPRKFAQRVAADHLTEDPRYYTRHGAHGIDGFGRGPAAPRVPCEQRIWTVTVTIRGRSVGVSHDFYGREAAEEFVARLPHGTEGEITTWTRPCGG